MNKQKYLGMAIAMVILITGRFIYERMTCVSQDEVVKYLDGIDRSINGLSLEYSLAMSDIVMHEMDKGDKHIQRMHTKVNACKEEISETEVLKNDPLFTNVKESALALLDIQSKGISRDWQEIAYNLVPKRKTRGIDLSMYAITGRIELGTSPYNDSIDSLIHLRTDALNAAIQVAEEKYRTAKDSLRKAYKIINLGS